MRLLSYLQLFLLLRTAVIPWNFQTSGWIRDQENIFARIRRKAVVEVGEWPSSRRLAPRELHYDTVHLSILTINIA